MRKKTEPAVDVAAVTAAWDAFLNSSLPVSKESLSEQGWKDADDLEELGIYWRALDKATKSGKLESKQFVLKTGKVASKRTFYRPKV
jgi:hypothetical protein